MMSVLVSQLLTLSPESTSPAGIYKQRAGKSLSCCFVIWAAVVNMVGAVRFLKMQKALLKGKITVGGWDWVMEGMGVAVVRDG